MADLELGEREFVERVRADTALIEIIEVSNIASQKILFFIDKSYETLLYPSQRKNKGILLTHKNFITKYFLLRIPIRGYFSQLIRKLVPFPSTLVTERVNP